MNGRWRSTRRKGTFVLSSFASILTFDSAHASLAQKLRFLTPHRSLFIVERARAKSHIAIFAVFVGGQITQARLSRKKKIQAPI